MAQERLAPDALLLQTNLAGALADIDEDPDSPDGSWLTADSNNSDSVAAVSFPTPTDTPSTGAGLQEFRIWARTTPNGSTVSYSIYLRENGTRINGGSAIATGSISSTSGEIISATWDASLLGTADGSLVECEAEFKKTGGPPNSRTTGELGAVEWNAEGAASAKTATTETGTTAARAFAVAVVVAAASVTLDTATSQARGYPVTASVAGQSLEATLDTAPATGKAFDVTAAATASTVTVDPASVSSRAFEVTATVSAVSVTLDTGGSSARAHAVSASEGTQTKKTGKYLLDEKRFNKETFYGFISTFIRRIR